MEEEELLYTLALQRVKGVGDITAKKLLGACGSAKSVFLEKGSVLELIPRIGRNTSTHIFDKTNLIAAEKELQKIKDYKIDTHSFLSATYPEYLKNCEDGPILFFQDGNFDFSKPRIISIVGTRNMTSYGKEFCEKLVEELAGYDPIIVSGFAYGVDICAHRAAVKNNLQTIGVFAHGLGTLYPKAHKKYVRDMYEKGGFITEFWYDEAPVRENFLKRNRIVAGISQATIVIESAIKGGSLVTADIANSYSREVFSVPGKANDLYSMGCNALIRDSKAALITSAKDVVRMLNWEQASKKRKPIQKQLFIDLTVEEQKVYDFLSTCEKALLDEIAKRCELPVYKVVTLLFQLEMKGVVAPLPGKVYQMV